MNENSKLSIVIVVDDTYDFSTEGYINVTLSNQSINTEHFYLFNTLDVTLKSAKTLVTIDVGSNMNYRSNLNYRFTIEYFGEKDVTPGSQSIANVEVKYVPKSQVFKPKDLVVRGFSINEDGKSMITLTNTTPLQQGAQFSLISGNYNQNAGGYFTNAMNPTLGDVTITYNDDHEVPVGSNLCIFFDENGIYGTTTGNNGTGSGTGTGTGTGISTGTGIVNTNGTGLSGGRERREWSSWNSK